MEITGKVHEIGAVQQVTDTFKKRDLIVEYAENPQFPEFIKLEATQDRTNLFDNLHVGQEVTASFNLRGRPWTNKDGVTTYFNTLVVWRINAGQQSAAANAPAQQAAPAPAYVAPAPNDEEDDLPF